MQDLIFVLPHLASQLRIVEVVLLTIIHTQCSLESFKRNIPALSHSINLKFLIPGGNSRLKRRRYEPHQPMDSSSGQEGSVVLREGSTGETARKPHPEHAGWVRGSLQTLQNAGWREDEETGEFNENMCLFFFHFFS